jgi:hypothetical protein
LKEFKIIEDDVTWRQRGRVKGVYKVNMRMRELEVIGTWIRSELFLCLVHGVVEEVEVAYHRLMDLRESVVYLRLTEAERKWKWLFSKLVKEF